MKGNVLDLAVAVIIGAAFGAIVTSLVNDVLMPPIGLLMGGVDFKDLFISLNGQSYPTLAAAKTAAAPVIAYGQFMNTVINFLIIAFVISDRALSEQTAKASCGLNKGLRFLLYVDSNSGEAVPSLYFSDNGLKEDKS